MPYLPPCTSQCRGPREDGCVKLCRNTVVQVDWVEVVRTTATLSLLLSACFLQPNLFEEGGFSCMSVVLVYRAFLEDQDFLCPAARQNKDGSCYRELLLQNYRAKSCTEKWKFSGRRYSSCPEGLILIYYFFFFFLSRSMFTVRQQFQRSHPAKIHFSVDEGVIFFSPHEVLPVQQLKTSGFSPGKEILS